MENNWIEFDRYHYYLKLDSTYIIYWKDEVSASILITRAPGSLQAFYMKDHEYDMGSLYPNWHHHLLHLIFEEKVTEYSKNDVRVRVFNKYFKLGDYK